MNPTKHTIETEITVGKGEEIYYPRVKIEFTYFPGDPGCRTMRNGDPGWPPTGADIEITGVALIDGDGMNDIPQGVLRDAAECFSCTDGYDGMCQEAEADLRDQYNQARADARETEY
jgi:hypothetical protein